MDYTNVRLSTTISPITVTNFNSMVLNYIWIAFFVIAFLMALGKTILTGDTSIWSDIMNSSFNQASFAFEISLGLTGILTLWLGIMKIGEKAGVIQFFGRIISPLFSRLFPGIPKDHPAMGAIFMNISANMLGLDNAATPMGLKAMKEMQSLNSKKDTATDAMIMFLVLNASGLCLIPISIMMYRAQGGASNPTDVFIPILIATAIAKNGFNNSEGCIFITPRFIHLVAPFAPVKNNVATSIKHKTGNPIMVHFLMLCNFIVDTEIIIKSPNHI